MAEGCSLIAAGRAFANSVYANPELRVEDGRDGELFKFGAEAKISALLSALYDEAYQINRGLDMLARNQRKQIRLALRPQPQLVRRPTGLLSSCAGRSIR